MPGQHGLANAQCRAVLPQRLGSDCKAQRKVKVGGGVEGAPGRGGAKGRVPRRSRLSKTHKKARSCMIHALPVCSLGF